MIGFTFWLKSVIIIKNTEAKMSKRIDLKGRRFGRLEVTGRADDYCSPGGHKTTMWWCLCDCGNVTKASTAHLNSGHTASCGCLRNEGGKEVRNLKGQRFGRLLVLQENGRTPQGQARWLCRCDCGKEKTIAMSALVSGLTTSCGCYASEMTTLRNIKHGNAFRHNKTRLYEVWCAMIKRCENTNDDHYEYYGGRGVRVAPEWHDFSVFKEWAYKNGYDENAEHFKCTIDRIDVDGNYEPNNCRWADWKTQMNNTRRNKAYKERVAKNG